MNEIDPNILRQERIQDPLLAEHMAYAENPYQSTIPEMAGVQNELEEESLKIEKSDPRRSDKLWHQATTLSDDIQDELGRAYQASEEAKAEFLATNNKLNK